MKHPDDPKTGSTFAARFHRYISEPYNRWSIAVVVILAVLAYGIYQFAEGAQQPPAQGIPPSVQRAIDKHRNDPPPPGSPPREVPKNI